MMRLTGVLLAISIFCLPLFAQDPPTPQSQADQKSVTAAPVTDPLQQLITCAQTLTSWVSTTATAAQAMGVSIKLPDMTLPTDPLTLIDYVYRLLDWLFSQYTNVVP